MGELRVLVQQFPSLFFINVCTRRAYYLCSALNLLQFVPTVCPVGQFFFTFFTRSVPQTASRQATVFADDFYLGNFLFASVKPACVPFTARLFGVFTAVI